MRDPYEYFKLDVPFKLPGIEKITVRKNLVYKSIDDDALRLDLYYPPESRPITPAVIFVHGDGPPELIKDTKDRGQYTSWGRLVGASGLIAVTFNHRSSHRRTVIQQPAGDVEDLLTYVVDHARELGIDATRMAIWTCSAGPPFILPWLLQRRPEWVRGIVVYYGLLDLLHLRQQIPETITNEVLQQFSPAYQLSVSSGPIPRMLIIRAGADRPWFTESIDRFIAQALRRNLAVEVINLPDAAHGFDVTDVAGVRHVIQRTLEFLKAALTAN